MPTFLLYSLKAAGCLAVFYLFYKLLLSRDTLHRMNRVLLCGVLLLSFLLPLCVITVEKELPGVSAAGIDVIPENYFRRDMVFENRIPDDTRDLMIIEEPEPAPEPFDWGVLLGIIYFAGMFATLGWTVCNIVRVVRMTRRGRRIPLGNGSVLVLSDRIRAPFSWMRYVVMSEEDYACGGGTILVHEQAHQRLGHSWDLLLVDLLGCLQWFNPAMWLLRVELRAVHEYEADEQVLRCGVNAKDYQMLLIKKAVGGRWYSIANSLNHSNLKNRITMMLRKRSSRWARAKALYVLPLACLALGAFAQTSYVLPEDKTTKNSGNGEMPLPAGAEEWVTVEVSDGAALIPFWIDLSDEGLYLLDGEEIDYRQLGAISPSSIATATQMTSGEARRRYGDRGRYGAIVYTSRPESERVTIEEKQKPSDLYHYITGDFEPTGVPDTYRVQRIELSHSMPFEFRPLVLWNGKVSNIYLFTTPGIVHEIETVRIVTEPDEATVARYGVSARNGVIEVVSKTASREDDFEVTVYDKYNNPMCYLKGSFRSVDGKNTYKVSGLKLRNVQGVRPGMLPLVAVDGRVGSITDLEKIPARKIETIQIFSSEDVFHNPALVKRYGDAARVGAILVTTRDAAKLAEKEARKSGAGESVVASVPEGPSFGTVQTGNTPVDGQVKVRISEVAVPNDSLVVSGHDLSSMLFLLDGRRVAAAEVKALNEAEIESMSVLKDEWAVERYGEAAADGVVYVTTTEGARQFGRLECSFEHGNSFQEGPGFYRIKDTGNGFAIRPLNGARPLVLINGRQVDDDYLKSIDAGKVLWVRILQPGFELLDRYGERAWDGVIEFGTNESGERTTLAVYSSDASGKRNKMTVVREPSGASSGHSSVSKSIATSAQPLEEVTVATYTAGVDSVSIENGSLKQVGLIVLDGEEISADRLSQLDPSRIDAMTVLKGEQAVEHYGEKGAKGVIEITTKKNRSGVAGE